MKIKTKKVDTIREKAKKKQAIPVTRNCISCSSNDDVTGCRLRGQLSPSKCVHDGFSYYRKGKQFFFCERCETHSVTSQIVGFAKLPNEPRIVFWCQNCDDYPIIDGDEYRGYPIEGIIFSERRHSFLDRKDDKGDVFR